STTSWMLIDPPFPEGVGSVLVLRVSRYRRRTKCCIVLRPGLEPFAPTPSSAVPDRCSLQRTVKERNAAETILKLRPPPTELRLLQPLARVCFVAGERRYDCDRRRSVQIGLL